MGASPDKNGVEAPGNQLILFVRRSIAAVSRLFGPDWPFLAAVLLVALIAAWPAISQPGLLNTRGGGDSPFLLQRLHQLTTALADGHFPVRWMPDANYGYGYPFYNYYAPLSIYVAAAFRFLGFSFVRAIHLAQLAGFVVAGLGMFYLGRRWLGSRWAGLLAAVAYTVAPFHMVNVYVRGDSLAEFWAMAFYPLVLLAVDGIFLAGGQGRKGEGEKGGMITPAPPLPRSLAFRLARPIALFALAYAGLILSHNISALIFSPFLLLYVVIRLAKQNGVEEIERLADYESESISPSPLLPRSPAPLLPILAALLLAFALAAWFFIPALAEQDLAQLGPVTEGYFHYSNHFRGGDLVQVGLIFDYNPDGGVAFRLGLVQAGLALAGTVVLLYSWRMADRRPPTRRLSSPDRRLYLLLGSLVAVVMITPLSRPLWDHLPLLPFTQFPWRFLSIVAFFAALLTGALVRVADRAAARAAVALLVGFFLLAAGLLGLRVDHLILTDADVTAERLAQYEWFTGNIGTTVSAEYLTPESTPRPWTSAWLNTGERNRVVAVSGALESVELVERKTTAETWRITTGEDGAEALFPIMYWPGWGATTDGRPTELRAFPSSGLMTLTVPAGQHVITLELGHTPSRLAAELVSLTAVIVAALLIFSRRQTTDDRRRTTIRGLWFVVGGLLLLAILAVLWRDDPRELPPGNLTWDFAQMAYLHHDVGGVAFENGARLHDYGYSGETIAAGDTLIVTLNVDPGDGRPATVALVAPASARPTPEGMADPPAIAATTQLLDGETIVFALAVPPDAPPGLYVPRLTVEGTRPLMPSGGTRGDLFLRPMRVESGGAGEQGSGGEGEATGSLDVRATSLIMRDERTLDGRFVWYTERPLGARYQFSWRLQDASGDILAQLDAQPGYGYQPSTLWPADRWTADWLALRLPEAAPAADYPLVMRLYDVGTGETVLTRRVGVLSWEGAWQPSLHEPSFALPSELTPLEATFGRAAEPSIAVRGYRLEQAADALRLTLFWQALADVPDEYTRFVHLLDAGGAIVAQFDGVPAGNSYPTGQWTAGEVVADKVTFDPTNLPPGDYRLATGFYQPDETLPRVSALAPDGPLTDGRLILPETISIPTR